MRSIKDLGGPKTLVNSVWDQEFITLGDKQYTLNDLEHRVIRNNFDDNRIHVALVCAAMSCPRLRREAYTGPQLNAQLNDQARHFVNNPAKTTSRRPAHPPCRRYSTSFPEIFGKMAARPFRTSSTSTPPPAIKSIPTLRSGSRSMTGR